MSPYDPKLMGEQPPLTGRAAFESAQRVHAALSLTIDEGDSHGDHVGMQSYRRAVYTGQAEILALWEAAVDAEDDPSADPNIDPNDPDAYPHLAARLSGLQDTLAKHRDVAAAAWGYRVMYEGYWGEGVPDSDLPQEQKARMLSALVGWQKELDAALAALDDKPGDFEAAKRDHRATIAKAIAEAAALALNTDGPEGNASAAPHVVQAALEEPCKCGHPRSLHTRDDVVPCEGTSYVAPGSFVSCECLAFDAAAPNADGKVTER